MNSRKVQFDVIQYATERICMILDNIEELPIGNAKPNKFEKYPRELIAFLEYFNCEIEPAMTEWKNRIARMIKGRDIKKRLSIEQENKILMEIDKLKIYLESKKINKNDLRHWKASLLARIMNTMSNSWVFANKYANKHSENENAFKKDFINANFDVEMRDYALEELGVPENNLEKTMKLAKEHLNNRIFYYKNFKKEDK
jgi:hypothetical protein